MDIINEEYPDINKEISDKQTRNMQYFRDNMDEINKKYKGKFVIIVDEKIHAIAETPDKRLMVMSGLDYEKRLTAFVIYVRKDNVIYLRGSCLHTES
jgi:hypothetical protein